MSDNLKVTVTRVDRIRSSREGNPRYQFQTTAGTFKTIRNGQANYCVGNDFPIAEDCSVEATLELIKGEILGWEA